MGQSSSIAGRGSRRHTSSIGTSTAQTVPEQHHSLEQPAVTPDDINTIGTRAGIQPKNGTIEACSSIVQQDMLHSNGHLAEPSNHYHPSASEDLPYQHTSGRPQRTDTLNHPPPLLIDRSIPTSPAASAALNSPPTTRSGPLVTAAEQQEEPSASSSSLSTKPRSFLSRLRSRRLSRRTSSSPSLPQEALEPELQIPIPSTSKPTLEDTPADPEALENVHVPVEWPMTPPEEMDAMFEERQRARRMIEATLMSIGSGVDRPLPSARSASSFPPILPLPSEAAVSSTLPSRTLITQSSASLPLEVPTRVPPPIRTPTPHSSTGQEANGAGIHNTPEVTAPQTPDRVYAVLPRRSRSNSPTLSSQSLPATPAPVEGTDQPSSPTVASATPDSISATPEVPATPPRHILVQGLVTQAPPRRSRIRRPSTRIQVPSTPSQTPPENDSGMNSDSGFWDELPGSDAMELDSEEAAEDSEDEDWQSTVSQLLNLRRDSPARRHRSENDAPEPEEDGIEGQANLIGRLLRVAAAATAATLIPGGLTVDGEVVPGFDDSGPLRALVGRRTASSPQTSRTNNSDLPSLPSLPSTEQGSAIVNTNNGPAHPMDAMNGSGAAPAGTSNESTTSESLSAPSVPDSTSEVVSASESPLDSAVSIPPPGSSPLQVPSYDPHNPSTSLGSTVTASEAMDISPPPTPSAPLANPADILASPTSPASSAHTRLPGSTQAGSSLLPGMMAFRASSGTLAAEGTFDRFLADLQRDVSSAIRSSVNRENATQSRPPQGPPAETVPSTAGENLSNSATVPEQDVSISRPESQATRSFSFFRAYRFPSRSAPITAGIPALPAAHPSGLPPSLANTQPAAGSPSNGDDMQIDQPAAQGVAQAPALPNIVPMLFVGVRSAASSMLADFSNSFGGSGDSASEESATSSPGTESAQGDSEMRDAITQTPPANTAEGRQQTDNDASQTHGFVLWIFGGLYSATHPLVLAPSLLGDETMSYEEMMRLADMIGQHKPPTVSKQEIAEAGLKTIKGSQVRTAEAEGNVRSVTADRCLICLEDYEEEEDVRVLNCLHCFHQGCVDRWLSDGANTCPACRKAGVEKEKAPSTQTEQPAENVDAPTETMASA